MVESRKKRLEGKKRLVFITYVGQDKSVSFPSTLLKKTSLHELFTWK